MRRMLSSKTSFKETGGDYDSLCYISMRVLQTRIQQRISAWQVPSSYEQAMDEGFAADIVAGWW